jgi:acetate kinase
MKVLVFNCGSSSLKYRLIEMPEERELAGGEAQRVGPRTSLPACIFHRVGGEERRIETPMPDHASAFREVSRMLSSDDGLEADVYGHRVVHGGTTFTAPTVVDDDVIEQLDRLRTLAPIHNPPATSLIRSIHERCDHRPQVAVFDTAFHSTIPERAFTYALPEQYRNEFGFRKFGFHGTSHRFVVEEAARILGTPLSSLNAVSCHLGSGGASLCAVRNGKSIDNTMGYSPLQGLIMSTRSGDLDPAITVDLLARQLGEASAVETLLNKSSGILGLTGESGDIRDVLARLRDSETGSDRESAERILSTYVWRIRKYLGAYLTVLDHCDAIVFTDTIGELEPVVRARICENLDFFGVSIDPEKNRANHLPGDIAAAESDVRVLIIRTNEELAIARESYRTLTAGSDGEAA